MGYTTYTPINLGSGHPSAGVNQTIVVIRPDSNAFMTIYITNTDNSNFENISVAIKPKTDVLDDQHWIAYNTPVDPSRLFVLANIGLGPNDQVIVSSENGNASFNVSGYFFTNYA
jgi:hypothetical protein